GGRLSGDPVGGGAHLDRDRGGQYRVQTGGQSQAVGQSLARLVRHGELGPGILGILQAKVTFHSGKYACYFPTWQVCQARRRSPSRASGTWTRDVQPAPVPRLVDGETGRR